MVVLFHYPYEVYTQMSVGLGRFHYSRCCIFETLPEPQSKHLVQVMVGHGHGSLLKILNIGRLSR